MSKEELREILNVHAPFRPIMGKQALKAMVAAYNRALDDALEVLKDPDLSNGFDGADALLKLKI